MADGVEITAGSGTEIATDDCGASGHTQIMKLAHSTDGSATLVPASSTDGLLVNLGSNNDVTVTGSVTANAGTNLNTSALSTSANQTTIIGHLDGVEGLLTTIDADTGGILTSVQTLDNAISGSEMQVDVVAALPAGDNNIGNVDIVSAPTLTVNAHAVTNAGTFAVQVDGSALTALQLIDDGVATTGSAITAKGMAAAGTDGTNARILKTDSSGELQIDVLTIAAGDNNIGNVDIASAIPAGTNAIGKLAANSGVDIGDVDVTSISAGTNSIGGTFLRPEAANGCDIFRSIDLDESEEEVKASAGTVYGAWVSNTATSTRFLKFYNATAANVTVGSTTPVITIAIPGNASDDVSGVFNVGGQGIAFGTAITAAATTGVADADTGAPGANEVLVNIFYK